MPNNRKFARFKTTLYVRYGRINSSDELSAIAKDISMGGLKLAVDKSANFSPDDFLILYLLIPQITIKVMGKVVWSSQGEHEKQIGISFINLTDTHKEDIYNYIFKYYREELTNKWWENM